MKHLFKDIDDLQKYFSFSSGIKFVDLESDLLLVEEKYFRNDILGDETMDSLLDQIDTGEFLSEAWAVLADRAKRPAAKLLALYHLPEANLNYTNAGMLVTRSEKAAPASDNRTQDLKINLLHKSQQMLDLMVRHLEGNKIVFGDWVASEQNQVRKRLILPSAYLFNKKYDISDNHWIFRKLVPVMQEVQETYVKRLLGEGYYASLIGHMEAGDSDADDLAVIKLLEPIVANYTMIEAIPRLSVEISQRGIILYSNLRNSYDTSFEPADENRLKLLINSAMETAGNHAFHLTRMLDESASAERYAAYFSGDVYTDPEGKPVDWNKDEDGTRRGFWS